MLTTFKVRGVVMSDLLFAEHPAPQRTSFSLTWTIATLDQVVSRSLISVPTEPEGTVWTHELGSLIPMSTPADDRATATQLNQSNDCDSLPSPPPSEVDGHEHEEHGVLHRASTLNNQDNIVTYKENAEITQNGFRDATPVHSNIIISSSKNADPKRIHVSQHTIPTSDNHIKLPDGSMGAGADTSGVYLAQNCSQSYPGSAAYSPVMAAPADSELSAQLLLPHAASSVSTSSDYHDPSSQQLQNRGSRGTHRASDPRKLTVETGRGVPPHEILSPQPRPAVNRSLSTPGNTRSQEVLSSSDHRPSNPKPRTASKIETAKHKGLHQPNGSVPSPLPTSIPLPPLSLPTYLQLELSSRRPSHLYIHRSESSSFPYESSRVKIERLLNFLFLPHQLESVLWFGTLACLDSWLYTFTILPLRLLKSLYILGQSWIWNFISEFRTITVFIFSGTQRMWRRRQSRADSATRDRPPKIKPREFRNHRRNKSVPSMLLPDDKADILKSLLIIFTCLILLRLDASRMYHWVRGQAAIKLYVIYNVLEVCDRLLSAIGQDVLECLFSQEALERKPDGHSKVLRPFWLFILALCYTTLHATALFYQVVTLNVAVNSYSNALITLLMSNQFVEIKSTVFKKFEKENLFQLTCADIVERFQLWHMLTIIAARNIVETGGFNWGFNALASPIFSSAIPKTSNSSNPVSQAMPPLSVSSILPRSFTLVPSLVSSLTAYVPAIGHVIGPFIIVLGSEMLIDWLKHAYINKFNNTRPVIYGRFLDILAKDYYTNAFGDQNLTKRFGLPVIPLSCLMIRASFQTYQMFVAAWLPSPSPSAASLASIHEQYSASRGLRPTSTAAAVARQIDEFLYQIPSTIANSAITAHFTTILIMLLIFLVLLACKLILGMMLLAFARSRYRSMKEREHHPSHFVEGGRRVGGWGVVEVDEDKRRWIYDDDPAGMKKLKDREAMEVARREAEKEKGSNVEGLEFVKRYEMVAKRIW